MGVYKNWHFEVMPKFEYGYFADRMQKVGGDKGMKAFMTKMRKVYKGELMTDEFADLYRKDDNDTKSKLLSEESKAPPMFEYINTSTTNNNNSTKN